MVINDDFEAENGARIAACLTFALDSSRVAARLADSLPLAGNSLKPLGTGGLAARGGAILSGLAIPRRRKRLCTAAHFVIRACRRSF
jgi:hypothetical protein